MNLIHTHTPVVSKVSPNCVQVLEAAGHCSGTWFLSVSLVKSDTFPYLHRFSHVYTHTVHPLQHVDNIRYVRTSVRTCVRACVCVSAWPSTLKICLNNNTWRRCSCFSHLSRLLGRENVMKDSVLQCLCVLALTDSPNVEHTLEQWLRAVRRRQVRQSSRWDTCWIRPQTLVHWHPFGTFASHRSTQLNEPLPSQVSMCSWSSWWVEWSSWLKTQKHYHYHHYHHLLLLPPTHQPYDIDWVPKSQDTHVHQTVLGSLSAECRYGGQTKVWSGYVSHIRNKAIRTTYSINGFTNDGTDKQEWSRYKPRTLGKKKNEQPGNDKDMMIQIMYIYI